MLVIALYNNYTLTCIHLYTGEFGVVYKARLIKWNGIEIQQVAVKTLKSDGSFFSLENYLWV